MKRIHAEEEFGNVDIAAEALSKAVVFEHLFITKFDPFLLD